MRKTLFIGSTCVDVILNVPSLPEPGKDENLTSQKLSVGGCAYNVSSIARQFKLPYTLCSPVGSGIYGDFVKKHFEKLDIPVFTYTPESKNGCCYCIVENNGRRTFLCEHGAEYKFNPEWFSTIDFSDVDIIYFCGLEVEDTDGEKIISFLESKTNKANSRQSKAAHNTGNSAALNKPGNSAITLVFAPGPRINSIKPELLKRIFAMHPVLHLNDEEALSFTKADNVEKACDELAKLTDNSVIITEGKDGAFCYDKSLNEKRHIPCEGKVTAIDTTGAGDCHCGTIIAGLKQGYTLFECVRQANILASYIVTKPGSTIPDEDFAMVANRL